MGSCLGHYCPIGNFTRKLFRANYYDRGSLVEFESLMEENAHHDEPLSAVVTEHERMLILAKCYDELLHEARVRDAQMQAETSRKEEQLELEEEAILETRREASRYARLANSQKEIINPARLVFRESNGSWQMDINVSENGNDADEVFLDTAKLRSLTSRTYLPSWNPSFTMDTCSTVSGDKNHTNGTSPPSSIDLEWENEEGAHGPQEKCSSRSTPASTDLEWDNDFLPPSPLTLAESDDVDMDTESLIQEIERLTTRALQETGTPR